MSTFSELTTIKVSDFLGTMFTTHPIYFNGGKPKTDLAHRDICYQFINLQKCKKKRKDNVQIFRFAFSSHTYVVHRTLCDGGGKNRYIRFEVPESKKKSVQPILINFNIVVYFSCISGLQNYFRYLKIQRYLLDKIKKSEFHPILCSA